MTTAIRSRANSAAVGEGRGWIAASWTETRGSISVGTAIRRPERPPYRTPPGSGRSKPPAAPAAGTRRVRHGRFLGIEGVSGALRIPVGTEAREHPAMLAQAL